MSGIPETGCPVLTKRRGGPADLVCKHSPLFAYRPFVRKQKNPQEPRLSRRAANPWRPPTTRLSHSHKPPVEKTRSISRSLPPNHTPVPLLPSRTDIKNRKPRRADSQSGEISQVTKLTRVSLCSDFSASPGVSPRRLPPANWIPISGILPLLGTRGVPDTPCGLTSREKMAAISARIHRSAGCGPGRHEIFRPPSPNPPVRSRFGWRGWRISNNRFSGSRPPRGGRPRPPRSPGFWFGKVASGKRIVGVLHPTVQPPAEVAENFRAGGIRRAVAGLHWVEVQIV